MQMQYMFPGLRFLLAPVFIMVAVIATAQTVKLTGKVLNEKNEPLPGVSIKIIGGGGTTTDIEGRFTLNLSSSKKYTIEFSAIGYDAKTINEVEAISGKLNELDIVLNVKAQTGDAVVVTAKANTRRETVNSILSFQKNTNTVASVISAESIRRSPDKNTGEIIKRTPGASLQEGKFIVIRGLADRYNQAMLNGILLTSTEPDRKTFSFDLIPATMIDNIIINKAFVPEYPGEWAGGFIQVNTKDIPSKNFLNVQFGTGFNTASVGKEFYREKRGGFDWLGIDDGARALPGSYTTKSSFDILTSAQKTVIGKQFQNRWVAEEVSAPINVSFQTNGGFTVNLGKKKLGGSFAITYNKSNNFYSNPNRLDLVDPVDHGITHAFNYQDDIYNQEISTGGLASLSLQINPLNKISLRSIININTNNRVIQRSGFDYSRADSLKGTEFTFKENVFFTSQVSGEHGLNKSLKLKWYGAFNILDGYIPDQRRILYTKSSAYEPYRLLISNSLAQNSGSRIYQSLSDYIYTAGADVTWVVNKEHTLKGGYMLQVKDRLFDAKLFAIYLPKDNDALRLLGPDTVFDPSNFGDGANNQFAFDAIKGNTFRYLANTILNAGFVQSDNQLGKKLRIVWGVRVENYDQLIGSVKAWDPRHTHTEVIDFLPGLNATYKLNPKTNIRLSGSQTVIRPELRELAYLNIFDFELNAAVQGNPLLDRTKVTNVDLRYELYPNAGETFSAGIFYKHFDKPIEALFNASSGGASSFNFQNADKATAYGVEIEFRKKLTCFETLKNFTLQGNLAYVKSKVGSQHFNVERPLQGQSPYLLNLSILYDVEKKGLSATLLFNQIGQRLGYVGDARESYPDIYEAGRPILDFQLSKKVLKSKGEFRLSIADILSSKRYFYQNAGGARSFQKGNDPSRFERTFGSTCSISFNYSIL
jgi:outer membrane receptor protein involved in Fe transport